jgi:16S rRNA (cytosine1402-N4)-methyltransferase
MKLEDISDFHVPVLLNEILNEAQVISNTHEHWVYFDGTFGRGGHARAVLENFSNSAAIVCDQDQQAIDYAKEHFSSYISNKRLSVVRSNFSKLEVSSEPWFDFGLLDLGVSSPQLDNAHRGFSFNKEGPLDMRMDQSQSLTASEILMECDEEELIKIFKVYGEVFKPYRVVRAIVNDRKSKTFQSTLELAELIARIDGWRKKGFHPATQYFMALRLAVNQELQSLEAGLEKIIHGLKPKGRLAVLTFHSLEDRIVKEKFKSFGDLGKPVYKKVIVAQEDEMKKNPRSRSAKLRVFEKN